MSVRQVTVTSGGSEQSTVYTFQSESDALDILREGQRLGAVLIPAGTEFAKGVASGRIGHELYVLLDRVVSIA
jgi:hypothetical protein